LIAAGALQCFAPKKLKEIQDKLRPKRDYSSSVFGAFFEKLRDDETRQPSLLSRFSGFMVMSIGVFMLVLGVLLRWRWKLGAWLSKRNPTVTRRRGFRLQ
jgi:hypothetical protein